MRTRVECEGGVRPRKFFRAKLLTLTTVEEIRSLVSAMQNDRESLMSNIHYIMWNMRGSLSRDDAWTLSAQERKMHMKEIEERMKMTGKAQMPLL